MALPIKVVIVEDHVLLMEGMHIYLSKKDDIVVVNCSKNGFEFLEQLSTEKFTFDILVLDINMHKLDDLQILRSLKDSKCHAKIIVHSSMNDNVVIDRCMKLGATSFIMKESFEALYMEIKRLGNVS